jgi:hypothetical protein
VPGSCRPSRAGASPSTQTAPSMSVEDADYLIRPAGPNSQNGSARRRLTPHDIATHVTGPKRIRLQTVCGSGRRKRYSEKRIRRKWDQQTLSGDRQNWAIGDVENWTPSLRRRVR